jgi:UDP-hydrolysing UDP-N-acetyl-D-glucosamine 2-epimerase
MFMKKRKICFIITSKIHYSRTKLILKELQESDDIELQIIVGASAILPNYGDVLGELERDGFSWNAKVVMTLEGGSSVAMAKTTGMGIIEFSSIYENLKPDIVLVRGDRYEVLAAVIAAAYLNIPIAHIEGGDITGTIDESVRHAVTKMAHIHFPTNEQSKDRIIRMGEDPKCVFNIGCPGLEVIDTCRKNISNELINYVGVGNIINIQENYLIVMQHSVTTEIEKNGKNIKETLQAIHELDMPTLWFWPNVDAGTDEISKEIRRFREFNKDAKIRFLKYLEVSDFIALLNNSNCLIGNSSAGIKEASFLGVPVVNVGTRQQGRTRSTNVIDVSYDKDEIIGAIKEQIVNGKYESSNLYFKENTSKRMTEILRKIDLYTQKRFYEE